MQTRSSIAGLLLRVTLIGTSLLMLVPASALSSAAAVAQANCRKINSFDVCDRFLQEWSKQGSDQASIYVNGLPITARRSEISVADGKSYDTQWFERAKYEAHPENKAPYDLLLGLLGTSLAEGRGVIDPYTRKVRNPADAAFVGIDKPADADGKAKLWFPETRHTISGKILQYWSQYGGLKQFGLPLSEQFPEINEADGKTYIVQYFERNRFELHPEKAAPYEVELGLLGVQQYRLTPVPGDQLPFAPPKGVKSSKGTLVIGITTEPDYLVGFTADNQGIDEPLDNDLVFPDPMGNIIPGMAWYAPTIENGGARFVGVGEDRHLQIKYKLRQGMKWSDGVEITSNDALFAYKWNLDPDRPDEQAPSEQSALDKLHNMDNPDKYTVIANFLAYGQARDLISTDPQRFDYLKPFVDRKEPVTDSFYYVAGARLLPDHVLSKISQAKAAEIGYWTDPSLLVTDGPYKIQRWDHGQQIVLVPDPYYALTAPGILNKIVFRYIPDHDRLVAQLKAGDIDVISGAGGISPAEAQALGQAGLTAQSVPSRSWEHIDFNLDRPYFKDKTVRQAILYAIDRQNLVNEVSFGKWKVSSSFIPASNWGSEENPNFPEQWKEKFPLHVYGYNPAKANQMLDQAGWLRGPDGIRSKGGVRLSFNYETTAGNTIRARVQALVSSALRAVGIDAKITPKERNEFFDSLGQRDFDFAQYAIITDLNPNGGILNSAGPNPAGFRNERFDQLDEASQNEVDRSKLYPLLAEMQSIYSEELPVIPLYAVSINEVYNPKLVNWETGPYGGGTYKVQAMYFK